MPGAEAVHHIRSLADQPGYRKTIRYSHADYFGYPRKDAALVHQQQEPKGPTLEQIHHVLACMPSESPVHSRDRAIVALAILTGARDDAIASLRLKHLDLEERRLLQRPRDGVRTKASKTMAPLFFPVGAELVDILQVWIDCLATLHWDPDDPLFPPCKIGLSVRSKKK
jgi:integrase